MQTLIVPAVTALIIFLVVSYVAVPVWRRARDRYSQYVPMDTISSSTLSLRHRLSSGLSNMIANPPWRRYTSQSIVVGADGADDVLSNDGEELTSVDPRTRQALAQHERDRPDNARRLSRE